MAQINFDATQHDPNAPAFDPMPPSHQPMVMVESGVVDTKKGNGQRITATFRVLDGEYKGRQIWDGFNIVNPNPQAQARANQEFSQLCHAVGVLKPIDTAQLHNRPFMAKVVVEPSSTDPDSGKVYPAKNKIAAYLPMGAATGTTAQPTGAENGGATPGAGATTQPPPKMPERAPWET